MSFVPFLYLEFLLLFFVERVSELCILFVARALCSMRLRPPDGSCILGTFSFVHCGNFQVVTLLYVVELLTLGRTPFLFLFLSTYFVSGVDECHEKAER